MNKKKILRICDEIENTLSDAWNSGAIEYELAGHIVSFAKKIAAEITAQPTIEPEVRHGRWENIPGMNNTVFCSECGAAADKYLAKRYKGCPFCLCVMSATDTNDGGKGGADNA
jgi:hypothetical protein